jgi:tetratricopeptide (TPR) repeat protein
VTRRASRGWLAAVVSSVAVVAASIGLYAARQEQATFPRRAEVDAGGQGEAASPNGTPDGVEPFVVRPPRRLPEGPPRSATLPPDAPDAPSFCIAPEDEPPPPSTITVDRLLRDRFEELVDRARRGGSAARRHAVRLALGADSTADEVRAGLDALVAAGDRVEDGFDFATNAALVCAHRALGEDDVERARDYGTTASRLDPREALAFVIVGLASERAGDRAAARSHLRQAHRLAPDEPAIDLALGVHLAATADVEEAVARLSAYVDAVPEDDAARRLRDRLAARRDALRGFHTVERDGVTLRYPPTSIEHAGALRLLGDVSSALGEAAERLGTPRRAELAVFLYPTRSTMRGTLCATGWTGAAYDGALSLAHDLLVRPEIGPRVVRHEVMHAALHESAARVPLWFDEGLAQHFAGETGEGAHRSWRRMVRDRVWIPFPSLEGSFMVIEDGGDAGLAYHQSLAMVSFMVDRGGPDAIRAAVATLREAAPDEVPSLVPADLTGDALLDYLQRRLEQAPRRQ